MSDPRIISIDIETYGTIETFPEQTVFHPIRSIRTDKVPEASLIRTVAITLAKDHPCTPAPVAESSAASTNSWSSSPASPSASSSCSRLDRAALESLRPGETMVLQPSLPRHLSLLRSWLLHADALIGHNIVFDVLYMRTLPGFRDVLDGRHTLIDTSVLNYLSWEGRSEKSLKDIGPVLGLYRYDEGMTPREGKRFRSDNDPALLSYNAQDSHNTMLIAGEFARIIGEEYPESAKLEPFSIQFFSDALWAAVRLSEAGVPLSRNALIATEKTCRTRMERTAKVAKERYDLVLSGEGSQKSLYEFTLRCFDYLNADKALLKQLGLNSIYEHHLIERTKRKKTISAGDNNRALLRLFLEYQRCSPSSPSASDSSPESSWLKSGAGPSIKRPLAHWDRHSRAKKLMASYTRPLLDKRTVKRKEGSPYDTVAFAAAGVCECPLRGKSSASSPSSPSVSKSSWSVSSSTPLQTTETFRPDAIIAFPSIYIVPSPTKDTSSDSGGQRQARFSMRNPAAATFPESIKHCEGSRFEGGHIFSIDLNQIELRVPAIMSGEPTLVKGFNENHDLHGIRAIRIFGRDKLWEKYKDVPEPIRLDRKKNKGFGNFEGQVGKTVNFADSYWAGAPKLQTIILKRSSRGGKTGVLLDLEICQQIVRDRPAVRPTLYQWQCKQLEIAAKQGYLVLPFTGHSRLFEGLSLDRRGRSSEGEGSMVKAGEVLNFPIQTTAACVLHRIAAYMTRHLPPLSDPASPCLMFANVYDALFFDVTASYLPTLRQIITDAVEYVEKHEYWSWLIEHYGHAVPLAFDITEH